MKSIIFLSLCFIIYIAAIIPLIFKLNDIKKAPQKYDRVRGYREYRLSFWKEGNNKRFGKRYFANLILVLPAFFLGFVLFLFLETIIQKHYFTPNDAFFLRSEFSLGATVCSCLFAIFEIFIAFHSKAPICVAQTIDAFSSDKHSKNWIKITTTVLVACVLCIPVMAMSVNEYSYADEERLVTHSFMAVKETVIPYDSIVCAETDYSTNNKGNKFEFYYRVATENGKSIDLMEFGSDGALYIHSMLLQRNIPIEYGEIDTETLEKIRSVYGDNTTEFVEKCFTVVS